MEYIRVYSIALACYLAYHTTIISALPSAEPYDEIIRYYRAAHALEPDNTTRTEELAYVLAAYSHRDTEALELYYHVLRQDPTITTALHNIGFILARSGHIEQAIEAYRGVIIQKPDDAMTHLNLALAYLTQGDLGRGFCEYEWRWEAFNEKHDTFQKPRWNGCDLKGKRIYVHAEQGFGDTFQFIRYLFLLKKMGAFVIFQTQPALETFLRLCPYIDILVIHEDPLPDFDYYSPLLSLPLMFNTRLDTVPVEIPYLYAQEQLVQEWHHKLAHDKQYKIGICWQGNAAYKASFAKQAVSAKSCELEHFRMLASIPGVTLYSLQKIDGLDQIAHFKEDFFVHVFDTTFDERHGRFMDTAAVIKNLDLVITIDMSIGHLAAALGVPTWILLPEPADWRWMQSRTDTPWYPNVRLFRQQAPGDWAHVMHIVAEALKEQVDSKLSEQSRRSI